MLLACRADQVKQLQNIVADERALVHLVISDYKAGKLKEKSSASQSIPLLFKVTE